MIGWDWTRQTRLLSGLEPDAPLGLDRLGKAEELMLAAPTGIHFSGNRISTGIGYFSPTSSLLRW
jgi:hypothetical protein